MKKNTISKVMISFLLGGTLMIQGCDSVFEELAVNPNQPSMGSYFSTPDGVNDAVLTMYGYISTQRCLGASGSKTQIIRSDEASSNSDYGKPGMYGNDLNASYYTIEQPYTLMYTTASQAAYIIETAPSVDFSGNNELRNAYMGEAHFWRAFAHYYLLINFRNISPIRSMPKNAEDYVRPLEAPADVWNFIQEDLEKAKELLPVKGYWKSDYTGRVTKAAASALLGKCYLYRSGIENYYGTDKTTYYNEAAKEFADIIDGKYGSYELTANYADNFDVAHENNNESILEIQFLGDVENNSFNPGLATSGLAFDSRGLMLPGAGVGYEGVVHNWLYEAFVNSIDKNGNTDIRMFSTLMFDDLKPAIKLHSDSEGNPIRLEGPGGFHWEDLYPATAEKEGFQTISNTLAHSFKAGIKKGTDYSMPMMTNADGSPKLNGVGGGTKEYVYNQPRAHGVNWRYIRYADVLMMYAEAVLSGGSQGSLTPTQAVNKVRSRANLAELSNVTMQDIKNERVLEFALEGHRFYDLLRWGILSERFSELTASDPSFKKFISATDYNGFVTNKHEWLPIPIN
ncbi:MAG: RagB/SusD family nutrient uptake outer membrane protein, partial [Parabacteroides sp.]|nr:RagB/SusD family nutrient uptake outer membrane protein [Parabacteroides sp.]